MATTFNARGEDIDTKPMWRGPWAAKRRCLIITDGFYEWQWLDEKGKKKQPYAIARADGQLTVMAGLWDGWQSKTTGEKIRSCTIVTTEANEMMATIHNHGKRMPVILEEKDWPLWLGEVDADLAEVKSLIKPCAVEKLKAWTIGPAIGSSKRENNSPSLIEPVPALC
jgi:putative SOS response-associated peptidase YedK